MSSTFIDLQSERNIISKSVLDLGHIPAGMELFPAADVEQLHYIKRVIDECDYYLLIVGGRYGSTNTQGVSFTELEYDYAVETAKPVLAFIHDNPSDLPVNKSDVTDTLGDKLKLFRQKIATGRVVQFWNSAESLQAKAITSLARAFQDTPQVGWVRANQIATSDALANVISLQSENALLRSELAALKSNSQAAPTGLAGLDTEYTFRYSENTGYYNGRPQYSPRKTTLPLSEVLVAIAREFMVPHTLEAAGPCIGEHLNSRRNVHGKFSKFDAVDLEAAMLQLVGLKLLQMYTSQTTQGTIATFFKLTDAGQANWLAMTLKTTS